MHTPSVIQLSTDSSGEEDFILKDIPENIHVETKHVIFQRLAIELRSTFVDVRVIWLGAELHAAFL